MATGASNAQARHHPDRCPQGRAGPDPAPFVHLFAARHSPYHYRREQDRPRRFRQGDLRSHRQGLCAFASGSASPRSCRSRSRRGSATTSSIRRARRCWYQVPACCPVSRRSKLHEMRPPSRSGFQCNGSTGPILIFVAMREPSHPGVSGGAIRSSSRPRAQHKDRAHCHLRRRPRAAEAGDAVNITLAEPIDVGRGDVLVAPTARPEVADQFAAHMIWMDREPLVRGAPICCASGRGSFPQASPRSSTAST